MSGLYRAVRLAYTEQHPVELTDFTCAQCRAAVGEPCRSPRADRREHGHATRRDKVIRRRRRVWVEATRHADRVIA